MGVLGVDRSPTNHTASNDDRLESISTIQPYDEDDDDKTLMPELLPNVTVHRSIDYDYDDDRQSFITANMSV